MRERSASGKSRRPLSGHAKPIARGPQLAYWLRSLVALIGSAMECLS